MKPVAALCALVAAWLACSRLPAAQPDELSTKVHRLVRQLDDDQLATRNRAEQELIDLGDRVLPLLPPITARTSTEVRQRLLRIRQLLERAVASRNTAASIVTLQGEMELAQIFSKLNEQTGNLLAGVLGREGRVSLSLDKVPYWRALDSILDRAGLDVESRDGKTPQLALVARPETHLDHVAHVCYDKAFRFELLQVVASRSLRNPPVNGLTVGLLVMWEPRLEPVTVKLHLDDLMAKDDLGNTLIAKGPLGTLTAEVTGASSTELRLPLNLPERAARQIASISGAIEATVLGRTETFEFSELMRARENEQSKAAATVLLEDVRKNGELYEVRMQLRFNDAQDTLASHRDWIARNKGYLFDATGRQIAPEAAETFQQRENQIGRVYSFRVEGSISDYKFVYETPGVIVKEHFSFQFDRVPLP